MGSLKDALKKAGLSSSKIQNDRESARGRVRQQSEKHQQTRNFCEVCELIQPDVERYKHRNPTVDAEWICAACADRESIHDQCRVTHQSDFAKSGRFRREFGPTLDPREKAHHKTPNRNISGNRRVASDKGAKKPKNNNFNR